MKHLYTALLLSFVTSGLMGQFFEPSIVLPPQDESQQTGQPGIQITAKKGSTFTVPLSGNPTTGYQWSVISITPADAAEFADSAYAPKSGLIGGGGIQTLTFNALKNGQATIVLGYMRPWEKGIQPVQTQTVKVTIR